MSLNSSSIVYVIMPVGKESIAYIYKTPNLHPLMFTLHRDSRCDFSGKEGKEIYVLWDIGGSAMFTISSFYELFSADFILKFTSFVNDF